MEIADALAFVAQNHQAVLSTRRRNGDPQMSPISAGVVDGAVVISSRAMLAKVLNLARDPRASLLAHTDQFFGPWVQLDGNAEVVRLPEALDLLVETYRSIGGEHPDWDDYRAAMVRDERVVIRLIPENVSGQL